MKHHILDVLQSTDFKSQQKPLKASNFAIWDGFPILPCKGIKQMLYKVFHNGDDDGVPHGAVGFVIRLGKAEVVRSSHQAGGFAGGDETGIPSALIVKDEKLAATAALGGAEAAGGVIKAKFEGLFAFAGPSIAGKDSSLLKRKPVEQLFMVWGDQRH